jgi:hypothetical protein
MRAAVSSARYLTTAQEDEFIAEFLKVWPPSEAEKRDVFSQFQEAA